VALQHSQPAVGGERVVGTTQYLLVTALGRCVDPGQGTIVEPRSTAVVGQSATHDGVDVLVQEPGVEQGTDEVGHASRLVELVHVRGAVGVHAGEQRHHLGQCGEVVPTQSDACSTSEGDQVEDVISGSTGGDHRTD